MKFTPPLVTHLNLASRDEATLRARVLVGSHERTAEQARVVDIEVLVELPRIAGESIEQARDRAATAAMRFLNVEVEAEPSEPSIEEQVRGLLKK